MKTKMPLVRPDGEGSALWFNNDLLTFIAPSADTDGAFTLFEERSQRGKVTPLHQHPHCDESFYVLEGEVAVSVGGSERRLTVGGFASVPRTVPHALMCVSDTARVLTLLTPGDAKLEAFFADAGEPAPERALPPKRPLDLALVQGAAQRSGSVVMLGPPPFATAEIAASDA